MMFNSRHSMLSFSLKLDLQYRFESKELLKRWLVRESEDELAVAAATSYETLLIEHGHQFPPPIWELVTAELIAIQDHLLPHWLLAPTPDPATCAMYPTVSQMFFPTAPVDVQLPSLTHMLVLLEVQRICGNVLVQVHTSLPRACFDSILTCLRESIAFARQLNDNYNVRLALLNRNWRYGCQSAQELPHMVAHEITGTREYFKAVCYHLPRFRVEFKAYDFIKEILFFIESYYWRCRIVESSLNEYLLWSNEKGDARSQSMDLRQRSYGYVPLVVDILDQLVLLSRAEMGLHLAWLYQLLTELIQTNSIEVRRALYRVFGSTIQSLLPLGEA
ncbi:hypothetical protein DYB36_006816 [Aphanomyces astaci]|uniref:Sec7/BIG1-like C-terminal domain-containing protein n=1 Tax=Aphanomyces astaci TaxID=112090 RepID=A0A397BQS7_APHAT|nr:hypothetical protein DYB36_006816 [Aphanomyces astaci]